MSDNITTELVNELVDSLRNHPAEWRWAGKPVWRDIVHDRGIKLDFYYITKVSHPIEVRFSWWQRRRLRAAFRAWRGFRGQAVARRIALDNAKQVLELMRAQP